jgi:hypothetical protein
MNNSPCASQCIGQISRTDVCDFNGLKFGIFSENGAKSRDFGTSGSSILLYDLDTCSYIGGLFYSPSDGISTFQELIDDFRSYEARCPSNLPSRKQNFNAYCGRIGRY